MFFNQLEAAPLLRGGAFVVGRTFASKKLRTLMNLVPVKPPSPRMTLTRESLELLDAALGVVPSRNRLQVVADQLVQAFAESFRLLTRTCHQLIVNGESYVHLHSIRAHILRVAYFCAAALSFTYAALSVPLLCAIGSSVG